MISGIVVCAALSMAAAVATNQNPESDAGPIDPDAMALTEPHYKPITAFDFREGMEEVKEETSEQTGMIGHATDVMEPDKESLHAYDSYLRQSSLFADKPKLKEVIHFLDPRHTFAGEYGAKPHKYPFSIFNATSSPVDVIYQEYAMRSIRYWLNRNTGGEHGPMILGDHSMISIKPRLVPHVMVMTEQGQDYKTVMGADGIGATTYSYGKMTKSVIPEDGPTHDPLPYTTIAVEACQGMVNVDYEGVVPGGAIDERHMKNVVYGFNDTANRHNIDDLSVQESVCNMLGRTIASIYRDGRPAFSRLIDNQADPEPFRPDPWLDYSLALPEVPKFIWLAKHVPEEWNELIADRQSDTPTVDYYRQHRHL